MTDAEIMELAEEMRQELRHSHHTKEVHCSNCKHCIVDKEDSTRALCECGHCTNNGWIYLKITSLLKSTKPSEFNDAYECPQFSSMSDEAEYERATL